MSKGSLEKIAFLSHCNQIFMVLHENRPRGQCKRMDGGKSVAYLANGMSTAGYSSRRIKLNPYFIKIDGWIKDLSVVNK